ncbi:MAG: histone deacetylase [Rhodospirillaceae bacterium]|nr:histone deacetylase [Rhodospirillaceae bacterium]MDG1010976.1 histone deacetylase [Amylibacter sp.]
MSYIPVIYNDAYDITVPSRHRFNGKKFSKLLQYLRCSSFSGELDFLVSSKVRYRDVLRSHADDYVQRVATGTLSRTEVQKINLPYSSQLVKRSFLALSGTYTAALQALETGIACHTAGGTHHAHFSNGSGFCVFNDLAFTAINLIEYGLVEKVLILDLDVHQGDGTIDICHGKRGIYTCSLHCEQNFPFEKRHGTRDVTLKNHLEDTEYLNQLSCTLADICGEFTPELVLYDAGVDVYFGDQLGKLDLSLAGILKRDCIVLEHFKKRNIPIATVIGGGYSPSNNDIAQRHLSIFQAAIDVF